MNMLEVLTLTLLLAAPAESDAMGVPPERKLYATFGEAYTIYQQPYQCELYLTFQGGLEVRFNARADREDLFYNVSSPQWSYLEPSIGREATVNFSFERGSSEYGFVGFGRVYKHQGRLGFGGSNLSKEMLENLVYEPKINLKPSVNNIPFPPIPILPKGVADAVNRYQDCIREVEDDLQANEQSLDELLAEMQKK